MLIDLYVTWFKAQVVAVNVERCQLIYNSWATFTTINTNKMILNVSEATEITVDYLSNNEDQQLLLVAIGGGRHRQRHTFYKVTNVAVTVDLQCWNDLWQLRRLYAAFSNQPFCIQIHTDNRFGPGIPTVFPSKNTGKFTGKNSPHSLCYLLVAEIDKETS